MAQQIINIGGQSNDGTGDSIREAFNKVNQNLTELYSGEVGGAASPLIVSAVINAALNTESGLLSYINTIINNTVTELTSSLLSIQSEISDFEIDAITSATYLSGVINNTDVLLKSEIQSSTATLSLKVGNLETSSTNFASSLTNTFSRLGLLDNELVLINNTLTYKADITYVNQVAASSTASIASDLSTLQTDFNTPGGITSAKYSGIVDIISNSTSSLSQELINLSSTFSNYVSTTSAFLSDLSSTFASNTASLSQSISELTSTVGTLTTTVTNVISSVNGIQGKYSLSINQNGQITGYELIGGGGSSSFIVTADEFKVQGTGLNNPIIPFVIDTVNQKVTFSSDVKVLGSLDGVTGTFTGTLSVGTTPAVNGSTMSGSGAVFNNNGTFAIGNSTGNITFNGTSININGRLITNSNLANNSVQSDQIQAGAVTNGKISGTLQSDNYFQGFTGWAIGKTSLYNRTIGGTSYPVMAEFNGVVVSRPTLIASGTYTANGYGSSSQSAYSFYFEKTTISDENGTYSYWTTRAGLYPSTLRNQRWQEPNGAYVAADSISSITGLPTIRFYIDTGITDYQYVYSSNRRSLIGFANAQEGRLWFTSDPGNELTSRPSMYCRVFPEVDFYKTGAITPGGASGRIILEVNITLDRDINSRIFRLVTSKFTWGVAEIT